MGRAAGGQRLGLTAIMPGFQNPAGMGTVVQNRRLDRVRPGEDHQHQDCQ